MGGSISEYYVRSSGVKGKGVAVVFIDILLKFISCLWWCYLELSLLLGVVQYHAPLRVLFVCGRDPLEFFMCWTIIMNKPNLGRKV